MTYRDQDLVAEYSQATGKAKFVGYVVARHIAPPVNENGNRFPGYAYIGIKRLERHVGSWRKEILQWLADISQGCEHVIVDNYDCNCNGNGPIEGLGEIYVTPGLDPSGQGALYCLCLSEPDVHNGCPHAGKCLHGVEKAYIPEDDESRWYCPHDHVDECLHRNDSREPCTCVSQQSSHNGQGVRERVSKG